MFVAEKVLLPLVISLTGKFVEVAEAVILAAI